MATLKFTRLALSDLDDIWDYSLEKWGAEQAEAYLNGIDLACSTIAKGKASIRQFPSTRQKSAFSRFEHHYIFFIQDNQTVTIIAVLHERMDLITRVQDRL